MNQLTLSGRLTADPEIRTTQNGKTVANLSIADNQGKDSNGKPLVNFFNCEAWEKRAELIQNNFKKGDNLTCLAKCRTDNWEKDGKSYSKQVWTISEIIFTNSKKEATNSSNEAKVYNEPPSVDG